MVTQWARERRRQRPLIVFIVLLAVAGSGAGCQSDGSAAAVNPTPPASSTLEVEPPTVEPTVDPVVTPGVILPRPTLEALPSPTDEERVAALDVEAAPLGTFVVAKPDAGIPTVLPPWRNGEVPLEIPVYDEPFGDARVLVYEDSVADVRSRHPLLHGGVGSPPLVLRVLAGDVDDEWIHVQAPVSPHNQSVWVRSLYFDFDFTTRRLEVDLAGPGRLRLIDGGAILLEAEVVKGRVGQETPMHVTYIDGGHERGSSLSLASFNQRSGPQEAGAAPRVVVSGGAVSGDLGSATTSGAIRVTDEVILDLSTRVQPGTPVIIFDSSELLTTVESVASWPHRNAATVSFTDADLRVGQAAAVFEDQRWQRCPAVGAQLICAVATTRGRSELVPIGSVYLTAKPDAGQELVGVGMVVPVYDEPGGPKRLLIDRNPIDRVELAYPTYHPTLFDQALVLRVIQGAPGDDWVLVQAPVRPHRQSVWVRSDHFDFGQTTKRFEVDLGDDGLLTFFDGAEQILTQNVVYGRESRPTVLHDTYVEQAFTGTRLSPAYGSFILTLASYSETLGTYGGGMPGQSLHGTNQPELMGRRVSSGGLRVPNEVIEFIAAQSGIVGASMIIYDSTDTDRPRAIQDQRTKPWTPAVTTTFPFTDLAFAGAHSYS